MPAVLAAAGLAVLYVLLDPPSADLAAQTYRVGLFEREGFTVYDSAWYGGHHMPAYSVLLPPLGAWLGLEVVAALAIVGATWAFAAMAAPGAAAWFAAGMAAMAVSGRLTFVLGAAVGTAAVLAAVPGRTRQAALGGALTALCSPVAALFAALIAVALWWERRDRATVALGAGAVLVTGALVVLFPEGGTEPFVASAFWPALSAALVAVALGRGPVRTGAALYALVLIAAFAIPSPLGGNATRLGALLGGPLALALLRDRRVLALAVLPLAWWTLYPAARDWMQAHGDPARQAAYYEPLLAELAGETGRVEIPFTEGHWEAARVASRHLLARGWERQLDRKVNGLFYEDELTAERYGAWLRDNAIAWVALPDAPLDYSAEDEAELIRAGLPYLQERWRGEHWVLYAVRDPAPLGASDVGTGAFTATSGLVRLRWTPYWEVVAGTGCVRRGPGDWTLVEADPPGSTVRVAVRFEPLGALSDGPRCR